MSDPNDYGKRSDDLEIRTPFGWAFRAGGRHISFTIAICLCAGAILWIVHDHDMKAAERSISIADKTNKVLSSQERLVEAVNNLTYILTLSDTEKTRLRLGMPDSLRKQLLNDERRDRN